MKKLVSCWIAALVTISAFSQVSTFPVNGAADKKHVIYAFVHARIQVDPETVIENGTMLIQDGRIVQILAGGTVPKGAVEFDMTGKYIYPSFIDPYTTYGMPEVKRREWSPYPQYESNRKGAYGWNEALKPETDASALFHSDTKAANEYRSLGFGTVMSYHPDGIARGTASCVTLNAENGDNAAMLQSKVAACYSFDKGSSGQQYPSSLMGAIALLRQTYNDADWYRTAKNKTEYNLTLEAWNSIQNLPQIFETTDKWNVLRADKLGDEFKVQYIFKGSGNEYQRMEEMKATRGSFILPLNFPDPYDVEDPYDAEMLDYADLKHWELAPLNPGAFEKNGIRFALTTSDLQDRKSFFEKLRKAMEYGLTAKAALRALTTTPAELLGISNETGALKNGMLANFIITNGEVFAEGTILHENWIRGERYVLNDYNAVDARGTYELRIGNNSGKLKVEGDLSKLKATHTVKDSIKENATCSVNGNLVTITIQSKDNDGLIRLSGTIDSKSKFMSGRGQMPDGSWTEWMATQTEAFKVKSPEKDTAKKDLPTLDDVIYPFNAYGHTKKDTSIINRLTHRYNAVLIKNVTVWTNEQDSVISNTDVYIVDGKIVKIAPGIQPTKGAFALVIDGTGKYLTPGIIDEHSHIGISGGVNEGTQAASSEVRIGDVINPDDINIYRQLAGGVTAVQQLHGSANPIGGQSSLIKLRWGDNAEQMKIEGAPGFIKFALGENVKQTNWGDNEVVRFPQTRMGVEQVYYDHFTRAKEYHAQWEAWKKLPQKEKEKTTPPRKDLELEAISEILLGTRFITCHSYVQSEINMLMHVGDSMGFQVNTFTHILEGYKVADKMKEHGAGGSSFSDWWAYKYEVKDAIPYNPAVLYQMGLITAVNSDDAEMARRLNQEAAKSMKYGSLTELQAMKLVTLNPARLLHLDKKMGSIKVGMDGDVVLWSDKPTSVYSRVEKTLVDGQVMYDAEEDVKLRDEQQKDRARIIQKMAAEKNGGAPTRKPQQRKRREWECEDMIEDGNYLDEDVK